MKNGFEFDLVVLVAGEDDRVVLDVLIHRRAAALGIKKVKAIVIKHPARDPGCAKSPHEVLNFYRKRAERALVVYDYVGSGREPADPDAVRQDTQKILNANGWQDRSNVLIIVPELEIWVWSRSVWVEKVLGWGGRNPGLREWLDTRFQFANGKPLKPKEAVEEALRQVREPYSSAILEELAAKATTKNCVDASFARLRDILCAWYGV